ncbi:MAG: CRISPR-associated endonuclease Cas1 [Armatimonadetes bacterium]|nr:CRISPR-associated endonuclease Cas1 [Armatimonadota bacterium]
MRTEFTLICSRCGVEFTALQAKRRFCSRTCYQEWWNANVKEKAAAKRWCYQPPEPDPIADDNALWALRGDYWQSEASSFPVTPLKKGGRREPSLETLRGRKPQPKPLILTGHGVHPLPGVRVTGVNHGALLVRNGFTHYPQKRKEWRLFPGDRKLPSRIILLNFQGEVKSYIAETGYADLKLREAQLNTLNSELGLVIATRLIQEKIEGCAGTIKSLPDTPQKPLSPRLDRGLEAALQELSKPVEDVEALRLIEGRAALAYFTCWQSIPIKWKGVGRCPIPLEWMAVGQRQSLVSGSNRNANHPVNAMLNYAYGVLESQVRIATVASGPAPSPHRGLDPGIGYLHSLPQWFVAGAIRPGRSALVYDLMEPLRPLVDRLLIGFIRSHTFTPTDPRFRGGKLSDNVKGYLPASPPLS